MSDPSPSDRTDDSFLDSLFRAWCDAPAFPQPPGAPPDEGHRPGGLSRREYVAARALQGALAAAEPSASAGRSVDEAGARAAELALAATEALLRRIHRAEVGDDRAALEHGEGP